jgi:hypothetical protein
MISLPAFVACEPGRVDAARGSIAVARRDALGLIWSSRSRLHCLFSRAFVPPREQVGQMELRSQYAGLFSGQHAMAVVAFNGEVDDTFSPSTSTGPAVWHLTQQPPPLIVGTVLSSSARVDSSRAQDRLFSHSPL